MWASCLEGRVLLRALATACRGDVRARSFGGICALRWKPEQEEEEEAMATPAAGLQPPAAAPAEEDPSWHKRGMLSLWPPIVPPS